MIGWNFQLNGQEFERTQGDSEGQGSLACFSSWTCQELDMTQRLNNKNSKTFQGDYTMDKQTNVERS